MNCFKTISRGFIDLINIYIFFKFKIDKQENKKLYNIFSNIQWIIGYN